MKGNVSWEQTEPTVEHERDNLFADECAVQLFWREAVREAEQSLDDESCGGLMGI